MKEEFLLNKFKKIHFVGVGGVSMSALAEYCLCNGKLVSGSDIVNSSRIEKLTKLGCKINIGHSARNVKNVDVVIYTGATKEDNAEIKYAKKKKIPVYSRGELLGEIISNYKNSVAISGCHGKTTTTAMISSVLNCAKKNPTVFLGGDYDDFGNFRLGNTEYALTEACEYKKSFLSINPKISVVLNIGNDHLDAYGSVEEIIKAFGKFSSNGISVLNADDEYCKKIFNATNVTFGINNKAHYYATEIKSNHGNYSFVLNAYSRRYGKVKLKTLGKHNVYNALATFAVCDILGINFSQIKNGLESFVGVKRRNEYIGSKSGVDYYADYAHHPDELSASISAFNESGGKILTVFQPHTYSRTKLLMNEFVSVLKNMNPLIIYETFPAREEYDKCGSALTLYQNIKVVNKVETYFANSSKSLFEIINKFSQSVDKVLILGAGDIYEIIKNFIQEK